MKSKNRRTISHRALRSIAFGALATTTALGVGIGTAGAAPFSPALPESPQLTCIVDNAVAQAQGASQAAKDSIRQSTAWAINMLPLPQQQKDQALRQLDQALDALSPAPTQAPQPAPAPAPAPQPAPAPRENTNPCPATAKACVDLAAQKTWLQENGQITFGPVPITSGKPGYETTKGYLSVTRKVKDEWSVPYNGPMPYSVYFTNDGEAFHEGSLQVPSHGCIHLSHDAAVMYFNTLNIGDGVYIW